MEHWQKVCAAAHMQEYIAAHITEPITLADLARKAGYSPWHAARIFREMTGRAPFDYIRTLRLSKAVLRSRGRLCRKLFLDNRYVVFEAS